MIEASRLFQYITTQAMDAAARLERNARHQENTQRLPAG